MLLAACTRLLKIEAEILKMPKRQRSWFFGQVGHKDCFNVARALKALLESGKLPAPKLRRRKLSDKHGDHCWIVSGVGALETNQFVGISERTAEGDPDDSGITRLILGTISRGYPSAAYRKKARCFFSNAECSASMPWSAKPSVPEHLRADANKTLPAGGSADRRLGPFRTRREAALALEEWWLNFLGRRHEQR